MAMIREPPRDPTYGKDATGEGRLYRDSQAVAAFVLFCARRVAWESSPLRAMKDVKLDLYRILLNKVMCAAFYAYKRIDTT